MEAAWEVLARGIQRMSDAQQDQYVNLALQVVENASNEISKTNLWQQQLSEDANIENADEMAMNPADPSTMTAAEQASQMYSADQVNFQNDLSKIQSQGQGLKAQVQVVSESMNQVYDCARPELDLENVTIQLIQGSWG